MFFETYKSLPKNAASLIYDILGSFKKFLQISSRLTLLLVFFSATQANKTQENAIERQFDQQLPAFYVVDYWGIENGLPQSSVTSIVQTKDGYIWVGTTGGLARFDGISFRVFDATNTLVLHSNRVFKLYEDQAGILWIGMERGGIICYADGKFHLPKGLEKLRDETITAINEDISGALWIGTENWLFRFKDGELENISELTGVSPRAIYSIIEGSNQNSLWAGTASGLIYLENGHSKTFKLSKKASLNLVNDLLLTENVLYLATKAGIFRFYDGKFILNKGLRNLEVRALYKENDKLLWAATKSGLFLIDTETGEPVSYSLSKELPDRSFTTIIRDRENNLWIGMNTGGLARLKVANLIVYGTKQGLPSSAQNVVPITQDWEGNIWMGLACGGLARLVNEKFEIYTSKDGLPNTCIWSLFADEKEKSLWIGTWNGGLVRFKDGKFTRYNQNSGLTGKVVLAIYRDRKGTLWVGTYDGGLNRFVNGRFIAYGKKDGLVSEDIRFITEDSSGALWIGTTGGVSKFENGQFINYTTENGLSSNHVRAIYEDSDGVIWIGTYGGGLNRLKNGHFTHYTKQEGLPDNTISRIIEDEEGNLWMSGNRGILRINRRELNDFAEGIVDSVMPIYYDNSDGMQTRETNGGGQPAGWRTQDGRLWFPTLKGAVVIDPRKIKTNKLTPPVFIEEVIIDKKRIENLENIELTSGVFNLEIRYTGLSFVAPEKTRFKYMLEGYDNGWVDANFRRTAFYTNLPPGDFRFHVIAANNDGVWNSKGVTLQIKVLPRFYQTWWFYTLVISAVLLFIFIIYSIRIAHLKQLHETQALFSRKLIESQEKERKRIAVELHDSLGQSLIIIKNYSAFGLKQTSNELKITEQLNKISVIATQALAEVRRISYDLRPSYLEQLGLTEAIEAMIEKIAESSEINFSFEIDDLDGLFSEVEEITLYRIVQEALNNIVRHSGATEATVEIKKSKGSINLTISDNGCGFILESQRQNKKNHLGLISIEERTRMLGGTCSIRTAKGKGTTVSIKINLNQHSTNKEDEQ
jgi:signal transduction histidine kinase/ligand-binding sensor domain-containing protein